MQTLSHLPVIFNGLAPGYSPKMPYGNALLDGPVAGGEAEACAPANSTEWLNQLTIEIHAVLKHKYFVCHGEDQGDGSTPQAIAFRLYHFASMMLDYDPARTVYESYFSTGASNLGVQPESWVVPQRPDKPSVFQTSDLLKASGVYGRSYTACYVWGKLVGPCGVLVNATSHTASYPWNALRYRHTLVLAGSGVYDGATARANGPAPPSSMAAFSGEVVFP